MFSTVLKVNDLCPEFEIPSQTGKKVKSTSFRGKWLVLYFYPKDETPGCTAEACFFRDSIEKLDALNCTVVGVSADSIGSHKNFIEKHNLPFTLLSDEEQVVIKAFGVLQTKSFMGREYVGIARTTFLIDPEGVIKKVYESVNPLTHVGTVIKDLEEILRSRKQ